MNLQSDLRESTRRTCTNASGPLKDQFAQDHVSDSQIPTDFRDLSGQLAFLIGILIAVAEEGCVYCLIG